MLLNTDKLQYRLEALKKVRLAVIGDACLDVYWWADMQLSRLSRETPHHNLPIVRETMSPGAAGNVAVNAAALGCARVTLISPVGADWRGQALIACLERAGVTTSLLVHDDEIFTPAYIKPVRQGFAGLSSEDPRIDFAPAGPPSRTLEQSMSRALDSACEEADVILVADQLPFGCISDKVREQLEKIALGGKLVIVDSREKIGQYKHMILKPNALEGWKALHSNDEMKPVPDKMKYRDYKQIALDLATQNDSGVCLTLGPEGCLWANSDGITYYPALREDGKIDIVGAGDAFLAAFGCCLATGADPGEAIGLASIVSNIVIHKTGMTGCAGPAEIVARHSQLLASPEPYANSAIAQRWRNGIFE